MNPASSMLKAGIKLKRSKNMLNNHEMFQGQIVPVSLVLISYSMISQWGIMSWLTAETDSQLVEHMDWQDCDYYGSIPQKLLLLPVVCIPT